MDGERMTSEDALRMHAAADLGDLGDPPVGRGRREFIDLGDLDDAAAAGEQAGRFPIHDHRLADGDAADARARLFAAIREGLPSAADHALALRIEAEKVGLAGFSDSAVLAASRAAVATIEEADRKAAADDGRRASRFQFKTLADLRNEPPAPWRILKVIPGRGLIVLYGPPGSGKSFLLLSAFAAVTQGTPWHGRRTRKGLCVLIASEGTAANRLAAHAKHYGLTDDDLSDLRILQARINLLDPDADLPELLAALARLEAVAGPIAAVGIDTLNRAMPGGNENSPEDMGAMVAAAKAIEERFQCAVIFVHHSGKDETKGSRGHSSLKGAADTELSVRRLGDSFDCVRELVAEKQRDAEDGEILLRFQLERVDLGAARDVDPDADAEERITSCAVIPASPLEPAAVAKPKRPSGANQKLVLQALERAVSLRGQAVPGKMLKGVTLDVLLEEVAREEMRHLEPRRRTPRANDAISSLKATGFVDWAGDYLWPKRGASDRNRPFSLEKENGPVFSVSPKAPESDRNGLSGFSDIPGRGAAL